MAAKTTIVCTLYVHVVLNGVIFGQILYDIDPMQIWLLLYYSFVRI